MNSYIDLTIPTESEWSLSRARQHSSVQRTFSKDRFNQVPALEMEEVRLQIDHPSVQELAKKGEVIPSFHIANCGKHYSLDPRPAVNEAKIAFDAYTSSAAFGSLHLDIEDPHNVLKDIVAWFHGSTIRIDLARCVCFRRFAEELGIPILLKWAKAVEAAYAPVPGEPILVPL